VRSRWRDAWPVGFDPPLGCHGSRSLATHAPLEKRQRSRCRQPRSRGFVRGAQAPSVTPGFSRGTRSAVVGKPHAVVVEQARRRSRAIRRSSRVVAVVVHSGAARNKEGCTTVHIFTPRMKNTLMTRNALRLENFHPRTVHIFSRGWIMNKRNTTTDASAFASVARQPRRDAFLLLHGLSGDYGTRAAFAALRSSSPATLPPPLRGGTACRRAVHTSLREIGPMCTFLKNRVRFASHESCATCTGNSCAASTQSPKMVHKHLHKSVRFKAWYIAHACTNFKNRVRPDRMFSAANPSSAAGASCAGAIPDLNCRALGAKHASSMHFQTH